MNLVERLPSAPTRLHNAEPPAAHSSRDADLMEYIAMGCVVLLQGERNGKLLAELSVAHADASLQLAIHHAVLAFECT